MKVTHANLASAAKHQAPLLGFDTDSRVFDFSSYSFDAYILNMFYTLLSGGCLCIPSDTDRVERISGALNDMKVNLALLTPSVARLFDPRQLQNLKRLLLGGEALRSFDVDMWMPHVMLSNFYGPSECTIVSTVNTSLRSPRDAVNIGHGAGTVTWIASPKDHNRLSPIGTVGELLIEGPLVCAGYHGDEEGTAAAFIYDPPWLLNGIDGQSGRHGKLYKTGDLVRYNSDGSLEYVGRTDTQVKLRGQRIELGEIEHHLKQQLHPEALEVFAEVIDPEDGSPVLIALVMLSSASTNLRSMVSGVTDKIGNLLPSYMIPSAYIPIQSVPLTASGKTDRKKLRYYGCSLFRNHMVSSRPEAQETQKPSTKLELQISRLWARALNLDGDSIAANDNFFSLGGDSIAAMRLIAMAREEGVSLTMASIFCYPQLSGMARKAMIESATDAVLIAPFSLLGLSTTLQKETFLAEVAAYCQVEVGFVEDVYPCTPLQEGLLALTVKQAAAYVSRDIVKLSKHVVDVERYRLAWEAVIARNATLRTRIFQTKLHGLVQVVIRREVVQAAEWARSTSLSNYLAENPTSQETSDGKLSRWAIITPPGDDGMDYFVWKIHHALYDGWTISIITDQVSRIYRGEEVMNTESPFNAFIHHLGANGIEKGRDYWESKLNDAAEGSFIFPPLPSQSYQPLANAEIDFSLDFSMATSNKKISKTALIWGAWAILMANIAQNSDVVFGATLAGRDVAVPGISDIVGPTITTVPVRIQVDPSQESVDFVANIKQYMEDMIPFQHFGLQNIRRINSDTKTACQFQTLMLIQPQAVSDGVGEDFFNSQGIGGDLTNFSTYALTLVFSMGISSVSVKGTYDNTLMDQPEVERLVGRLEKVVQQLCRHPYQKIGKIDCVSDQELQAIWDWNAEIPESVEQCVHDLFTVRAKQQPHLSAITAWDGEMTYQELDGFSTQLAMYLVGELGVKPGVKVPLCFEKTMWMPVAMLGVLKAGGAFVAMDASQPEQRLVSIVAQSAAKIMLTSEKHLDLIRRLGAEAVVINRDNLVAMQASQNLKTRANPSSILCVVFTSGSTGNPKGVKLTHANFSSAAKYHAVEFGFKESTRMLDFASYSFDVSISGILVTLLVGGCVCVPHDEERINDIEGAMTRLKANSVHLTPAVARLISPSAIPSLDLLMFGGEKLNASDVTRWISRVPRLINSYGPAECTVTCLANLGITMPSDAASIGKGIGVVTWITSIDDQNSLAPIGAVGELLIEGPLVSPGYVENVSTTAFVSNPTWLLKGCNGKSGRQGTLYKTGDLVRYNSEGSLLFIGRKDTQVKLRGQRVELSEIEHHLRRHLKNIVEVAVEMVRTKNGSQALLAFVSAEAPLADLVSGLLTASGKTDRRRLIELSSSIAREHMLDANGLAGPQEKREPSTWMEWKLQGLWARMLNIEPTAIGADDDFFREGGDSIVVMRLVGIAREEGLLMTVRDVFKYPKLSKLALLCSPIENGPVQGNAQDPFVMLDCEDIDAFIRNEIEPKTKLKRSDITDIFPVTGFQADCMNQRFQPLALQYAYLDLEPDVDVQRLFAACKSILYSFETFRTVFVKYRDSFLQVVLRDPPLQTLICESKDDVRSFSTAYCRKDQAEKTVPLGQLFTRFILVIGSNQQRRMILKFSHAQYDGFCVPQIFSALQTAYQGNPILFNTPFSSFVHHRLQTKQRSYDYWRKVLRDSKITPEPRFEAGSGIRILKSRLVTDGYLQKSVRPAVLVSVAWALVLAEIFDETEVVYGHVVAGRSTDLQGIESVVGPCINIIPVQVKLQTGWKIMEVFDSMAGQLVSSGPFEGLDWNDLVDNCTNWPRGTQFGSVVHHRNIDFKPQIGLEVEQIELDWFESHNRPAWTGVTAHAEGSDLRIHFFANPESMNDEAADMLLEKLITKIQGFMTSLLLP